MAAQTVLILDFGGQYKELIARRVRECGVYSIVKPGDISLDKIREIDPIGIILTGGPNSVYEKESPHCDKAIFDIGIPVLGICYGMQLLSWSLGGEVAPCSSSEYGRTKMQVSTDSPLFAGLAPAQIGLMSHTDQVTKLPVGFRSIAHTISCENAAIENAAKKLYGFQFHPEVESTPNGTAMIRSFLYSVCGAKGDYDLKNLEQQLISDVKKQVGDAHVLLALSGGVDSSVVSAVCAAELRKKGVQLTTFSFDFKDNDKYFKSNSFQPSQDAPFVKKMVDFLKSNHHYLTCDNRTQADLLYESVDAHDLPCMADIDSSLLYFCREVSKSHKVVLTGECADEVFGGYPWFHREEFLKSNTFPWTPSLTPRQSLLSGSLLDALQMEKYVQKIYDTSVSEIAVLPTEDEIESNRRRIGYLNIRYFMQTLLNRMDRTSMHSSLEARVPFADRALVEYIFNVPWEMKAKDGTVKNVLRQASKGLLPDEILFRKKSPYPKTYHPAYEALLCERLKDVLSSANEPLLQLVDKEKVLLFLDHPKDYGTPWYGQLMAGPQMTAYLLQINYWLKKYQVTILL